MSAIAQGIREGSEAESDRGKRESAVVSGIRAEPDVSPSREAVDYDRGSRG